MNFQSDKQYKTNYQSSVPSMSSVSQISLSSNINSPQTKQSSSSKFDQSTEGGQTSTRTFDCNSSLSKKSLLTHQIHKLEQAQIQMERKFEKCIESLIRQIEQKEALSNRLTKQINEIKENIQDSKKDIQTISSYVRKNVRNTNGTENRPGTKILSRNDRNTQILGSHNPFKRTNEEKSTNKASLKLLGSK